MQPGNRIKRRADTVEGADASMTPASRIKAAMDCSVHGYGATTQYALVSYIPDPLGSYLNDLRNSLVPGCRLQSHVTILPPRPLSSPVARLMDDLRNRTPDFPAFEITLGDLEIFPVTNVIYISLSEGRRNIENMHEGLSRNLFSHKEPFPFHPHLTLAQEIPEESVGDVYARACQRWEDWKHSRSFPVENVVFVRNVGMNGWENLSVHDLKPTAILRTA